MSTPGYIPLLEITRGTIVESIHYGAFAVVDATGRLLASSGDPDIRSFLRSSAKPFQALPFVERGGVEHFGLSDRELALICASHTGTDEHLKVVIGLQQKVGIQESNLLCGRHPVPDEPTAEAMLLRGEQPRINRHNCSGKHSGMLAHARMRDLSLTDYIDPQHPIQQTILAAFAEMCALPAEQVEVGIDGCSVPTFAVPLRQAALGIAKLCQPDQLTEPRAEACRKITAAMTANPDMVGGPGRFDTELMLVGGGKLLSKAGAEGYQVIGLLPGELGAGSPGIGIALKISDGDLGGHIRSTFPGMSNDSRARPIVMLSILKQLGALNAAQQEAMSSYSARPITNWKKIPVGEYRTVFTF
jgi:L-asparaginase II